MQPVITHPNEDAAEAKPGHTVLHTRWLGCCVASYERDKSGRYRALLVIE
jgi:hypothetical protein